MNRKEIRQQLLILQKQAVEFTGDKEKYAFIEEKIRILSNQLKRAVSIKNVAISYDYGSRSFLREIRSNAQLYDELLHAGWRENRKRFYPKELDIIEKYFG